MHIAHSNIVKEPEFSAPVFQPKNAAEAYDYEQALRAYKRFLKENAEDIADIQKDYPGWLPAFRFNIK